MSVLYQGFGLVIDSDFPVPGGFPGRTEALSPVDVRVRVGRVPQSDGQLELGPYSSAKGGVVFTHPTAGRFFASAGGNELVVEAAPGVGMDEVAGYLVATALPMLLWMRGEMVLHAAAGVFAGEEQAVAFAGDSGSGKSAVLGEIVRTGGLAVADDSVCLRVGNVATGLPMRVYERVAASAAERGFQDLRVDQCRESAVVKAVVVLRDDAEETGVVRLSESEALVVLMRNRHRPRVPDMLGLSAGLLPRWVKMAQEVPVFAWTRGTGDVSAEVDSLRRELARYL